MRRGIYRLCLVLFVAVWFLPGAALAQTAGTWSITSDIDRDSTTPGVQINEGDGVTLTFVANGLTSGRFTVRFRVRGGTVDASDLDGVEGQSSTGPITTLPHETGNPIFFDDRFPDYNIKFNTVDDSAVEGDETFVVETIAYDGSGGPNVSFTTPASITITILANDAARTLTVTGPSSITETDSDLESGDYTITLTGTAFSSDTTVTWTVTHGTTSDADFVAASDRSGTVSFGTGDGNGATRTFSLTVAGDNQNESDETFSVQVSVSDNTANGGTFYGAAASTTIVNDDADHSFVFTNPVTSITEGSAATTYTVTRTGPAISGASGITVTWAYAAGTPAPAAADFMGDAAPAGGTLVFTASETSKTFTVTTKEDSLNEPGEQFTLTLSIAAGAHTTAATAEGGAQVPAALSVTIADDDPVTVAITRSSGTGAVAENNSEFLTVRVDFTITLSGGTRAAGVSTTVPFSVGGSGITVDDYDIIASGVTAAAIAHFITIGHGSTTGTITLNISDDDLNEAQESLTVTGAAVGAAGLRLSGTGAGAVEYTSGGNTASVPISDADDLTVTIANAGTDANDSASGFQVKENSTASFTVTLSGATDGSSSAVTVAYTVGGDVEAADYTDSGGGALTIPANTTSGTISISILEDADTDISEDITVTLDATGHSAAGSITRHATASQYTATQSIVPSADHFFTLTSPAANISEGDSDADTTYTMARNGPAIVSGQDLVITWTITAAGANAASAADFSANALPTGAVTFTGSQTSRTFDVGIEGDNLNEAGETFTIGFSVAAAHTAAADANNGVSLPLDHNVTIGDDDAIAAVITATTAVAEGANAVVSVNLGAVPSQDVTVAYTLGNTAATTDVDATLSGMGADLSDTSGGSITIAAAGGVATGDITVGIGADNRNEAAETFTVAITAADITGAHGTASVASGGTQTFTIAASDPISVGIARASNTMSTVNEGQSAEFTVTLSGASGGSVADISVPYAVAISGSGYTLADLGGATGTLTITAGQTSGTITIQTPLSTTLGSSNPDQTVTVTLTGDDAATMGTDEGPTAASGGGSVTRSSTASDQSAQVQVSFVDFAQGFTLTNPVTSIDESDSDANTTYTLARSGPDVVSGMDLVVTWAVTAGTAAAADFTGGSLPSGTLTFSSAATSSTFNVGIAGDNLNEAGETFTIGFSIATANTAAADANGGAGLPGNLSVTIADDDPISVTFARRASPMQAASVTEAASLTVHFAVGITGGTRTGEVTLPFTISGVDNAEFAITAPGGIAADATGGTVTLDTSDTTVTGANIVVTVTGNGLNQATRTLIITGGTPSTAGAIDYASASANTAEVMIEDDDGITVTLTRGGGATGAVREGGTVELVATLTRTDGGTGAVTSAADICVGVEIQMSLSFQQTPANDAASGPDIGGLTDCDGMEVTLLVANSRGTGGINIPAGQSSATQTLTARFDSVPEGTMNERLDAEIDTITSGTGAGTVAAGGGLSRLVRVNIQNVDAARSVSVSAAEATVQEGGEMVFTVTVTGRPVVEAFNLTWAIGGVDAADVSADGGMVSFTADADQTQMQSTQMQTVRVTAVDDTEVEGGEMLTFTLTDPCAGVADNMCDTGGRPEGFLTSAPAIQVSTAPATVTIAQSDQPITLSVAAPAALTEGTAAGFTVSFPESITTNGAVTVDWAISFPAATATVFPAAAADFMAASGSATIPMGESSATIAITAVDDDVNEAVESFTVTLSNPDGGGAIAAPVLADTPSADGTVAANDPAEVRLSRTQTGAVVEGGNAEFVVSLVLASGTAATSGGAICVEFGTEVGNQQPPANDSTSGADIALPANCEGMAVTAAPATGAASGSVLIPAGQSSATLSIATRFDSIDEGDTNERLEVTLSGATARAGAGTVTHATGAMGMANAEIQNVNSLRTLAVSGPAVAVDEDSVTGAGQTVPVEFTITMDGTMQPATPVEVRWRLNLEADGSISPPASGLGRSVAVSDVSSPQTGSVTFGTGETFPIVRMVTVQVQQDALNEGAETLRLTLDAVPDDAGGQPDMNVPGTRVIADSAAATIAASDDITVFLTADDTGTVTSGDDARYTLSFGTTMVNGQVVPIVPTTQITVPLTVRVGGDAVTVPDVVVQPGAASAPVVIPAAQINAQSRGAAAMIEVTAQAPTGAPGQGTPGGATAQVATTQDVTEETARRNMLSQTERERLGLVADVAMAQRPRQVAGWTVAISQPSADAPEGSDWNVVFTLGGDRAALGGNTITVPWSLAGRAIGGAEAAVAADFAASTATPPAYTCGANAEGVCSSFPDGTVTFTASSQSQITVAIRVRDDGVAEGNDPQGFRLTLGTISGTAAAQTVTTGATTLQAAIPALRANLSVTDATASEGQSAEFVLTLSGFNGGTETTQPITVAYTLTDGPATGGARSGEDFTPPATAAGVADCPASRICTVIPSGAREGTAHRISVPLILDGVLEPRETFTLTITHALRGGGNIRLVADAGADPVVVANEITATGTIGDDADQGARRRQRVSALVTVLDRQTALLATDAISARLSRARTDNAQSASLSIANRNLISARNAARSSAGAANAAGAPNIGLALYGASGRGGAANLLGGGASAASLMSGSAGAAFGGLGAGLAGGANMGTRTVLPTLAEALNGSSFRFGAASDVLAGLANFANGIEVWGSGGYVNLRSESRSSGLTYDGESIAAFIGADAIVPQLPNLLAGLAVGWSAGDLDFTDRAGGFQMRGEFSNDALSVHPYFGWQLSPHANAWLVLGFGAGSVDIEENEGSGASAISRKLDGGDSSMLMFSTGITGTQQIGETGDLKLRFVLTRVHSRVDSGSFDDGALLPKTRGRSLRMGGEAEAGRRITLENGLSLRPFGTLRLRLDNTGAESGEAGVENAALDWGAGITAAWADLGLDGRFAFRRQLNDTGDEEQGATLDVNFAPGATGQGIAISLQTALQQRRPGLSNLEGNLGDALLGANNALSNPLGGGALGANGNAFGASADAGMQHSLSGEIAYGVALRYFGRGNASRAALLTPYGRFHLGSADTRWAAGLRLANPGGLQLGLEAGLHLNSATAAAADAAAGGAAASPRSYDLLLTGRLPF